MGYPVILTPDNRIVLPRRWMTRRRALLSLIPIIGQTRRRWIVAQDFEGTGVPPGWGQGGSADFDYSAVPLVGAQSLRCSTNTTQGYYDFGAKTGSLGEVWAFARFKRETTPSGSLSTEFGFLSGSPGTYATVARMAGVTSGRTHALYAGSASAGNFTAGSAENVSLAIWLRYKKGTGSNAIAEIYVAEGTEVKPGSPTFSTAVGNATANATVIYCQGNPGGPCVFDKVRVSASVIGSNPL